MRARARLEHHPRVSPATDAREAVRPMVEQELPALVVRGDKHRIVVVTVTLLVA